MLAEYEGLRPRWGKHYGSLQAWYAVLSSVDQQVFRILRRLDELGLGDNTVVAFSSDSGPESGLIPLLSRSTSCFACKPSGTGINAACSLAATDEPTMRLEAMSASGNTLSDHRL